MKVPTSAMPESNFKRLHSVRTSRNRAIVVSLPCVSRMLQHYSRCSSFFCGVRTPQEVSRAWAVLRAGQRRLELVGDEAAVVEIDDESKTIENIFVQGFNWSSFARSVWPLEIKSSLSNVLDKFLTITSITNCSTSYLWFQYGGHQTDCRCN